MKLGTLIKIKRNTAGLTIPELATLAGISAPYISHIEIGRATPTSKTLRKLSEALAFDFEIVKTD
jgi:transcriptional regulator with XRE-family HTH domain